MADSPSCGSASPRSVTIFPLEGREVLLDKGDQAPRRSFHGSRPWLQTIFPVAKLMCIELQNSTASPSEPPILLLIFSRRRNRIVVYSHSCKISADDLALASRELFNRFIGVTSVEFQSLVDVNVSSLFPFSYTVRDNYSNYLMRLHGSADEYVQSLTLRHRRRLHYYERRFKKDFPEGRLAILTNTDIDDATFNHIFALSSLRMVKKQLQSQYTALYIRQVRSFSRTNGIAFLLTDGTEVCARSLWVIYDDIAYLIAVTHVEKFDKYSPGILSLFLAIQRLANRGVRQINFLAIEAKYKFDLGATAEERKTVSVYRRKIYVPRVGRRMTMAGKIAFLFDVLQLSAKRLLTKAA